eukprot:9478422-Pyramimonas_sp.AAC.1
MSFNHRRIEFSNQLFADATCRCRALIPVCTVGQPGALRMGDVITAYAAPSRTSAWYRLAV